MEECGVQAWDSSFSGTLQAGLRRVMKMRFGIENQHLLRLRLVVASQCWLALMRPPARVAWPTLLVAMPSCPHLASTF